MVFAFPKIDFRQQPGRRELVGFFALMLAVLFAFVHLLWSQQSEVIKKAHRDISLVTTQQDAIRALVERIDREREPKLKEGSGEVQRADDVRLKNILDYKVSDRSEEIASTVTFLSDRRLLKRLDFKGADVGTIDDRPGYAMVPFKVHVEGRYSAIVRYLEKLEQADRPLLVSDIDMSADKTGGFLVANLNVGLYLPK